MIEIRHREKPAKWADFQRSIVHRWLLPFLFLDWVVAWAAYFLSKTSILEFLEYCGSFSILVGVIFYFKDAPERTKLKHYQAWQVINTAQGKGGSGGRSEALHELNEDHIPLVGVDLSDAFLEDVNLQQADLRRSNFHGTDLKGAKLTQSNLEQSTLNFCNLRESRLKAVNLTDCDFSDADLNGAILSAAILRNTDFSRTDLRGVDLAGLVDWKSIASLKLANIHGIQQPPDGFIAWAIQHGAVDLEADSDWEKAKRKAAVGK